MIAELISIRTIKEGKLAKSVLYIHFSMTYTQVVIRSIEAKTISVDQV